MEDELSADEYELYADQLVDQASAAETIAEMETEICLLQGLEQQAQRLRLPEVTVSGKSCPVYCRTPLRCTAAKVAAS